MVVANDEGDFFGEEDDTLKDLFPLIKNKGKNLNLVHTKNGRKGHQSKVAAATEFIEVSLRINGDTISTPTFLRNILVPFNFFPGMLLAAARVCYPESHMLPLNLDIKLVNQ
jgi:hypothetical protein